MLGHLRSAEFTNLIEGVAIGPRSQRHLEGCSRCRSEWMTLQSVHARVSEADVNADDGPEPEWTEFRAAVRDRLLSRSVRRERVLWTGWLRRPTPAWTLAVFAAAGFIAAVYLGVRPAAPDAPPSVAAPVLFESESIEAVRAVWTNVSVFEEAATLSPEQSERFRELLEHETQKTPQDDSGER